MAVSRKPRQIAENEESTHYIPPRKLRRKAAGSAQPPLTPMIDVTFQLLIFFLLTATFRPAEGQIPGSVPGKGISEEQVEVANQLDIRVSTLDPINRSAQFTIVQTGGTFTTAENLHDFLDDHKKILGENWKDVTIVIDPELSTQYGHAAEAYNQAVRAGFEKVSWKPVQ
jgi:biopolymer transport protein ExbD